MDNNPGSTDPLPPPSHDTGPGGTVTPGGLKIMRERQDWHKEQEKVAKERWKMEAQLDTLRRTIHHLTEENNQLHVDLIHAADGLDAERIRARLATRNLEEEIEALRFVNTQHLRALATKDGDVEREQKRVEEFLKVMEGGKGVKRNYVRNDIPTKPPDLIMDVPIEPLADPQASRFPLQDAHTFDIVVATEKRIHELVHREQELLATQAEMEGQIEHLQSQLTTREEEIARLGELFESDRGTAPPSAAAIPGAAPGPPRIPGSRVEQLEMQIEYYQDQVFELTQKVSHAEDEKSALERVHAEDKAALAQQLVNFETLFNELYEMQPQAGTLATDIPRERRPASTGSIASDRINLAASAAGSDFQDHMRSTQVLRSENLRLQTLLEEARVNLDRARQGQQQHMATHVGDQAGRLGEMQRELRKATVERDNIRDLYEQVNQELQLLRQNQIAAASASSHTNTLQQRIRTLTAERDSAEAKYQDAAHDLASYRRKLGDAEAKVKSMERDRRTSQQTFANPSGSSDIARLESELARLRSECERQATGAEDAERRVRELERERSRLQAELAERARRERDGTGAGVGTGTGARLQQLETEVMRLRADEARATAAATEWRGRLQALERETEEAQDGTRTVGEGRATAREARLQARAQQLQNALDDCAVDIRKYKEDLQAYEKQCQTLTKTLATVETELQETSGDRAKLLREIKSTRELSQALDRSKDELQNQVRLLSVENEKLQSALRDVHRDREDATNELRAERTRCERLEKALADLRTEKFQTVLVHQQLLSSKAALEHQLQTATRQQAESDGAVVEELAIMKEDNRLLARRVDQLQREITLKETELVTLQVEHRKSQDRLKRYEEYVRGRRRAKSKEAAGERGAEAETGAADPTSSSASPQNKSDVERKIVSELEKTRQQMKQFEVQIQMARKSKQRRKGALGDDGSPADYADSSESPNAEDLLAAWRVGSGSGGRRPQGNDALRRTRRAEEPSPSERRTQTRETQRLIDTIVQVQSDLKEPPRGGSKSA